ncbi:MAG: hypothetical protein A4E73_03157 [Syntrophaceae bacterium PtaU1.Bin231]|nr:MAG: hypothetical protein A4E73_03157 [Syntrophaceae bacterium PtaU1.Bin231]HOG16282.1 lysophospholipid acyltransferase family protein [Syntrophales bacterium]
MSPSDKRSRSPWKTRLRYFLLRYLMLLAYGSVRLYFLTIRTESVGEERILRHLGDGGRVIAALWHQRIVSVIGYAKKFGDAFRPSVMISKSRDGDLAADVFSRMNFRPVRGSSSRDGKAALTVLLEDLKVHPFAVHILDGPRGPRGVVKAGLIVLAQKSGVPIVPVYASVSRAWVLRSWDRCLVPKPFSRIVIRFDGPMLVGPSKDEGTFEEIRRGIEKHMLENQRLDDARFGWKEIL